MAHAKAVQKVVWQATAIPADLHEDAALVAKMENRQLGMMLDEILRPLIRTRLKENIRRKGASMAAFKRKNGARS